ncbi:polymer-forming cytoskeletal protein [Fibrobacter sp. UWEL]|uniref:bactofilin family protein n=1 Tax=Fibrobacter sp. UWEL TaxID=1896209 RepID=UPI00090EC346|nr:polymer-forming cytoskeletal protein [Fibrobacter sp. UWEL]SHL15799.1 Polymer-forming protein [Fibrobacter sp. UWEL]
MATKGEQEITQIGNSVTLKGDVSGKSDVRVAGNIIGSVNIEGEIIVERQGYVEGEVKSLTAVIAGTIKGNIECAEKLILESTSKFIGNIKTKQLIIQEGAQFQGNCQMGVNLQQNSQQQAPKSQPQPEKKLDL